MELDPSAVSAGVRLVALETIGSTNSEARSHAQRGDKGPLWVTAVAQTITFATLANKSTSQSPVTVTATATSNLAVTFTENLANMPPKRFSVACSHEKTPRGKT